MNRRQAMTAVALPAMAMAGVGSPVGGGHVKVPCGGRRVRIAAPWWLGDREGVVHNVVVYEDGVAIWVAFSGRPIGRGFALHPFRLADIEAIDADGGYILVPSR